MWSCGSSQVGSRAKCWAMVKVPLGTPRVDSISAALMSSLAREPDRIDFVSAASAPISGKIKTREVKRTRTPLDMIILLPVHVAIPAAHTSLFDRPDFPRDRVAGLGGVPVPMKLIAGRQHARSYRMDKRVDVDGHEVVFLNDNALDGLDQPIPLVEIDA